MPHITVKMYPGRSDEIKRAFAEKLVEATSEALSVPKSGVSVSVVDIPRDEWDELVTKPEIEARPSEVYIRPGEMK